jgi:RND family efflux transporter MFP subunit
VQAAVVPVQRGDAPRLFDAGGVVRAQTTAVITSRLLAPVLDVRVVAGDRVRAGQVLVRLDDRDLAAQARRASSGRQAAEQGGRAAVSERDAATAALAFAEATHRRIAALHGRTSATDHELDEAVAQLRAAEARLASAEARVAEAQASFASAVAGADAADVGASWATITAPFAGVVTETLVEAGSMASPGTPLLRLERTGGLRLDVRLDESRAAAVRPGQDVELMFDGPVGSAAEPSRAVAPASASVPTPRPGGLTGRITEVARAPEAGSHAFLVKIVLPGDLVVPSGTFARARFAGPSTSTLTVPRTAVVRRGQLTYVYVVDDELARLRLVNLGAPRGDDVEVLAGLDEGERVVRDPSPVVSDGSASPPEARDERGAGHGGSPRGRLHRLEAHAPRHRRLDGARPARRGRTPAEEEPQIIVPMIDVFVQMPGASPTEVQQRVTRPLEKLLWEVPGVEYLYSTSSPGQAMVIVRFYVGEAEEPALVRLNQKIAANMDRLPPGVSLPLVKPRSIDDVPVMAVTLWGSRYDDHQLRLLAGQLHDAIKEVPDVSEVTMIGGRPREVSVEIDPARLAAYEIDPLQVQQAIQGSNVLLPAAGVVQGNERQTVEAGARIRDVEALQNVVVASAADRPILLRDLAQVRDGDAEPTSYVMFHSRDAGAHARGDHRRVEAQGDQRHRAHQGRRGEARHARGFHHPGRPARQRHAQLRRDREGEVERAAVPHVHRRLLGVAAHLVRARAARGGDGADRDPGDARAHAVRLLPLRLHAQPHHALRAHLLHRHPRGRRHRRRGERRPPRAAHPARSEGLRRRRRARGGRGRQPHHPRHPHRHRRHPPDGLRRRSDGPLHAAHPGRRLGGHALLARRRLHRHALGRRAPAEARRRTTAEHEREDLLTRAVPRFMGPLIRARGMRVLFLAGVVLLLVGAAALVPLGWVKVKMLPFDNKSEFQVIVDMPEGTPLEGTARVTAALAAEALNARRSSTSRAMSGTASPYNFNGLVRHYFLRQQPHLGDLQVNLLPRHDRSEQSHDIAKRVREALVPIAARYGATIQVAEVPPGPPVLQTLVAEVYGPDPERRLALARQVRDIFEQTPGVVDVDWYVEDPQPKWRLEVDHEKVAAAGLSAAAVASVVRMAGAGETRRAAARRARPRGRAHRAAAAARRAVARRARGRAARRTQPGGGRRADAGGAHDRGAEPLPQEPAAGDLRHRRRGRGGREPRLRHPADAGGARSHRNLPEGYAFETFTATARRPTARAIP